MSPQVAEMAIQFLLRVQLQGREVPAFNEVMQALSEIVQPRANTPTIER